MKLRFNSYIIRSVVFTAICFLLTSTGWLAWEYRLMTMLTPDASDVFTMFVGYLLQAFGILIFSFVCKHKPRFSKTLFFICLILFNCFLIPSVTSPSPVMALTFGFLMNLMCGGIAGNYLTELTKIISDKNTAKVFGFAYGSSVIASWLLSLLKDIYYSEKIIYLCFAMTGAIIILFLSGRQYSENKKSLYNENNKITDKALPVSIIVLSCLLIFLFALINSLGFAFSSADISASVSVETTRMIYAAGLIIAGILTDRNRRYGAVCSLISLMLPFVILALSGENIPAYTFWILSYFIFGFHAVYRIVLFSDFAKKRNLIFLSGFGLMFGRFGDAVGEILLISFGDLKIPVLIICAVVFSIAVITFFKIYNSLYSKIPQATSEKDKFYQFSAEFNLSSRERDMLKLVLDEKTNIEIADILSISENTVKYHMKNILSKTGCKNRNVLISSYSGYFR